MFLFHETTPIKSAKDLTIAFDLQILLLVLRAV